MYISAPNKFLLRPDLERVCRITFGGNELVTPLSETSTTSDIWVRGYLCQGKCRISSADQCVLKITVFNGRVVNLSGLSSLYSYAEGALVDFRS